MKNTIKNTLIVISILSASNVHSVVFNCQLKNTKGNNIIKKEYLNSIIYDKKKREITDHINFDAGYGTTLDINYKENTCRNDALSLHCEWINRAYEDVIGSLSINRSTLDITMSARFEHKQEPYSEHKGQCTIGKLKL
ncbi:hypothetical protein [Marinomonas sp. PE14-40]|uniref:hypothetical protein n=1 Tax=Marinomonas sp. PE14-40 TaxID=3060621 RepID=UPI003F67DC65